MKGRDESKIVIRRIRKGVGKWEGDRNEISVQQAFQEPWAFAPRGRNLAQSPAAVSSKRFFSFKRS